MTASTATATKPRTTRKPAAAKAKPPVIETPVTETPAPVTKKVPVRRRGRATVAADHAAVTVDTARKATARVKATSKAKALPVAPRASRAQLRAVPTLPQVTPERARVEEAVGKLDKKVIMCRTLSHHWHLQSESPDITHQVNVITVRCSTCDSVRQQFIDNYGQLERPSQIRYSKGYLVEPGLGVSTSEIRGATRLAFIAQFGSRVAS